MRTRFHRPIIVTLVCFALLLAGCRTNPYGDLPEKLVVKTRTFEDVVRWGALEKMYLFLKRDDDKPLKMQEGLDNVRVTGYDLAEELNEISPMRWRQAAVIDYVLTDRQVVRQLIDYQVWESEDEGKTWYRTTPVPVFK